MKTVILLLLVSFAATVGRGQGAQGELIKQRAKALNEQNNARQGITPGQHPPPAAPAQPPVNPALAATMQNVADLQADFVRPSATNSASVQMLAGHMDAAAVGRKAKPGTVTALALDLTAALKDKPLPAAQATTLAQDVHALFNSSHLSRAQQQTICDRVQGLLLKHGVSADQTASVVNGLSRVAAETK